MSEGIFVADMRNANHDFSSTNEPLSSYSSTSSWDVESLERLVIVHQEPQPAPRTLVPEPRNLEPEPRTLAAAPRTIVVDETRVYQNGINSKSSNVNIENCPMKSLPPKIPPRILSKRCQHTNKHQNDQEKSICQNNQLINATFPRVHCSKGHVRNKSDSKHEAKDKSVDEGIKRINSLKMGKNPQLKNGNTKKEFEFDNDRKNKNGNTKKEFEFDNDRKNKNATLRKTGERKKEDSLRKSPTKKKEIIVQRKESVKRQIEKFEKQSGNVENSLKKNGKKESDGNNSTSIGKDKKIVNRKVVDENQLVNVIIVSGTSDQKNQNQNQHCDEENLAHNRKKDEVDRVLLNNEEIKSDKNEEDFEDLKTENCDADKQEPKLSKNDEIKLKAKQFLERQKQRREAKEKANGDKPDGQTNEIETKTIERHRREKYVETDEKTNRSGGNKREGQTNKITRKTIERQKHRREHLDGQPRKSDIRRRGPADDPKNWNLNQPKSSIDTGLDICTFLFGCCS